MIKKTSLKKRLEIKEYFKRFFGIDNIWIQDKEELILKLKDTVDKNILLTKELYQENPHAKFFSDFSNDELEKIKKFMNIL